MLFVLWLREKFELMEKCAIVRFQYEIFNNELCLFLLYGQHWSQNKLIFAVWTTFEPK